jgi:hypothetical protein
LTILVASPSAPVRRPRRYSQSEARAPIIGRSNFSHIETNSGSREPLAVQSDKLSLVRGRPRATRSGGCSDEFDYHRTNVHRASNPTLLFGNADSCNLSRSIPSPWINQPSSNFN